MEKYLTEVEYEEKDTAEQLQEMFEVLAEEANDCLKAHNSGHDSFVRKSLKYMNQVIIEIQKLRAKR